MDQSIQLALEKTLKAVENEWETKYAAVEQKMAKILGHVESLESERDTALSQLEASISSSSIAELNEQQLKEELTLELTESLTKELTDQLTEQLTAELTETLAKKIERKYKKKYKQMQQELEEQKATSEQSSAELNEDQRQKIEVEITAAREQCELDYTAKLTELQKQNDERVQSEKVRMRKLVRALLEREAKLKRDIKATDTTKKEVKKKKKKQKVAQANEDNGVDEMIQSAASLSSRRKKQSRKGVPRPSSF